MYGSLLTLDHMFLEAEKNVLFLMLRIEHRFCVDSYNFGIAVFEKYFLLGNSYCESNCFSRLTKRGYSTGYTRSISFLMPLHRYVFATSSHFNRISELLYMNL